MNPDNTLKVPTADESATSTPGIPLADSVAEVYDAAPVVVRNWMLSQLVVAAFKAAPPLVRRQLLERLIRPLGLLSLAAVAGGIFAKIRLRSGWENLQVQIEDVQNVNTRDLIALVEHVQQVSAETVAGVARIIADSPWMAGSAISAVLVTMLVRSARAARCDDDDDVPAIPT